MLLFIGTEPNLRWRAYSDIVTDIAVRSGAELIVSLGALLDAVPHTREPRVTGRASSRALTDKVQWLGIRSSRYQGPTGIHTAFTEACNNRGLEHASIWGHSPHYVQTSPNPRVSHALLTKLRSLVDFEIDLQELNLAGDAFLQDVSKAIASKSDVRAYVTKLEERHDAAQTPQDPDLPEPEEVVRELEDFLRSQRPGGDGA